MEALTPAELGTRRSALYRGVASGAWERVARGIYLPAGAPASDWDQLEVVVRRPDATVCLVSALVWHDLTDDIPQLMDVAIPRGARAPAVEGAIRWHHFDRTTFELGRGESRIEGTDRTIGIYGPERTIADCFRLRAVVGYEIARDATKEWLRRGGKPAALIRVARELPRATTPVLNALELLA